jgi:hypothetical protein
MAKTPITGINPDMVRVLRLITENPGHPGTHSDGFDRHLRERIKEARKLGYVVSREDGWYITPAGTKLIEDFDALQPRK